MRVVSARGVAVLARIATISSARAASEVQTGVEAVQRLHSEKHLTQEPVVDALAPSRRITWY